MKITEQYEALPKIAKILLQVFLGGLIGGIYRILRYLETKNIVTLVVGILCLVTGVGNFIAWVVVSDHRDYAEQDFGPGRLSSVFRKQKGAAAVQGVLGTVGLCLFFFFGSAILSSSDRKALNFCFIPTEEKALEAVKSRTALQGGVFSGNGSFPVSPCFSLLG